MSRRITTAAFLLSGAALCALFMLAVPQTPTTSWLAVGVLAAVAVMAIGEPAMRATLANCFPDDNKTKSPREWKFATAVCISSAAYLLTDAFIQKRNLTPFLHDEFSYHLQAQIMAWGRLWMPALPIGLADFFESFHILVKPVYASIYFPGTALVYVPFVWVHLPLWMMSVVLTSTTATLMYLLVNELLDHENISRAARRAYGVLAVLMLVAVPQLRWNSTVVFSHLPAMLAGMLIVWTWLRWRSAFSLKWVAGLGTAVGWAAIVRPFDLLAYAIPVGVLAMLDLRGIERRKILPTLAIVALAAAPFIALQLILNQGTTGRWFDTPYSMYVREFQPGAVVGFHHVTSADVPQTLLQQKLDLYRDILQPMMERHQPGNLWNESSSLRFRLLVPALLPSVWFLIALPAGIYVAIRDRRKLPLILAPLLFLALYIFNPYFAFHYPIVVSPAIVLVVVFGIQRITASITNARSDASDWSKIATALPAILAFLFALATIPEIRFDLKDGDARMGENLNAHLADSVQRPAVVLFRYQPGDFYHFEPVYNYQTAWPLDAAVIRAHDLGPEKDQVLFRYFAATDPTRTFYLFDRKASELHRLGKASELLQTSAH